MYKNLSQLIILYWLLHPSSLLLISNGGKPCWRSILIEFYFLFFPRLRSCETALNLLEKYRNEAQEEKIEMEKFENDLRNQKIEDLGPTEAELEAERLRVRCVTL